jgi:hypothetical protein
MTGKNPAIGTVPCPVAGCGASCEVRKFKHRATRDTGVRVAGRMYFDCPEHGRFGFDGKPGMQDYILTKGTIWGAEKREPAEPAGKAEPAPTAKTSPAPTAAPKKSSGWGFFQ